MTVISYPIPPYQNLPIQANFYRPSQFFISAIVLGLYTMITTSIDHNYVIGQQVRLIIPASYGSFRLNNTFGYILDIPSADVITVDIDSSENVDAFILSSAPTQAQILAIGDINTGKINHHGPVTRFVSIPGSFINISPE